MASIAGDLADPMPAAAVGSATELLEFVANEAEAAA